MRSFPCALTFVHEEISAPRHAQSPCIFYLHVILIRISFVAVGHSDRGSDSLKDALSIPLVSREHRIPNHAEA